ncbi:MAG: hypothetical protein V2J07_10675, partial [Anaerolineae bacterium]|nr:hypothetical protein [Anaerolineae bacterium]
MNEVRAGTQLVLTHQLKKNRLVGEECRSLTGVEPHNGVAWHADLSRIARAAYISQALEVIACGEDFTGLCADIRRRGASLNLREYRIELINRSNQPISISAHIKPLADTIEAATGGVPNLSAPHMKVILLVTDQHWVLADIVGRPTHDYAVHEQKPHRSSSALPVQLARGIINLLPAAARTVLDPCCGSGTFPIEAGSLGYLTSCGDQSPKLAWM